MGHHNTPSHKTDAPRMLQLACSEAAKHALHYARSQHPHPRVPPRLAALWAPEPRRATPPDCPTGGYCGPYLAIVLEVVANRRCGSTPTPPLPWPPERLRRLAGPSCNAWAGASSPDHQRSGREARTPHGHPTPSHAGPPVARAPRAPPSHGRLPARPRRPRCAGSGAKKSGNHAEPTHKRVSVPACLWRRRSVSAGRVWGIAGAAPAGGSQRPAGGNVARGSGRSRPSRLR
jgi:hypothetical protein